MPHETDFGADAPGRLIRLPEGYFAFAPNPLPPTVSYEGDLPLLIEKSNWALGQLYSCAKNFPGAHILTRGFEQREAQLSTRIEGTVVDSQELLAADQSRARNLNPEIREVQNYQEALRFGLASLEKLPVSLRLMKEMHNLLLHDVRGEEQRPGEFRQVQNYVGGRGGFSTARYIPPPVKEMSEALDQLERFIHAKTEIPALVRLALIHYQFEAIHPFRDGNGRIGRLLIPLLLCEWKLLPKPLLTLSAYLDRHREKYFDCLLGVSQRGAWSEWILFFL